MSTAIDFLHRPTPLGLAAKLTPAHGRGTCPCGVREAGYLHLDMEHAKWHLQWSQGVRPPASAGLFDELNIVRGRGPAARVAEHLARLMQRENGYDFPLYHQGCRSRAYVACFDGRAIALAVVDTATRWGWYGRRDAAGMIALSETRGATLLAGIFVCANYRRRGVASALVRAVAEREDVPLDHLVWQPPLSDGGAALALSLVGREKLRIGR